MKVLVTGGTGYIGSHTCIELLKEGYEIVILDNLSNSYKWILDSIKEISGKEPIFYNSDLTDDRTTHHIFKEHPDIQAVIHFAALKAVGESVSFPLKYYRNNLNSLTNLLQIMEKYQVPNLVFSSSCTVYGQPEDLPVSENCEMIRPFSPYGNTKKISEEILQDVSATDGLQTISLRYFNPIGAHPSGRIGELPLGVPNNLLPYITQTAFGILDELKVFGKDYDTHDGTAIRDYIHISDLAKAHAIALKRLEEQKNEETYEAFNLGTGVGYSVLDVVNAFEKVSDRKIPLRFVDRRPGDIEKVWADPAKANQILGWQAERDLDDMVKTAWEWENYYRNNIKKK